MWIKIIVTCLLLVAVVAEEKKKDDTRGKRNLEYSITHSYPPNPHNNGNYRSERRISNTSPARYNQYFPGRPYTYFRKGKPQSPPPYAVQMEPLVHYSQRDPLYDPSALHSLPPPHNELSKTDDLATDNNHLSENLYSPPKHYIDRPIYIKEPEPIIEIIIKEANTTQPPIEHVTLPPKKKKEQVEVFYVKYKKNPNGSGKDAVIYDKPVRALSPVQAEPVHDEHEEQYSAPEIPVTYAPPPATTIRAIIKPDSETYHADTGIRITFGGPKHNPHAEKYSHDDEIVESAPQPSITHPQGRRFPEPNTFQSISQDYRPEQRAPQPYKPFNFNFNQPPTGGARFSQHQTFPRPVSQFSNFPPPPSSHPPLSSFSSRPPPFQFNQPKPYQPFSDLRPQQSASFQFPRTQTHFPIQQQPPLNQPPTVFNQQRQNVRPQIRHNQQIQSHQPVHHQQQFQSQQNFVHQQPQIPQQQIHFNNQQQQHSSIHQSSTGHQHNSIGQQHSTSLGQQHSSSGQQHSSLGQQHSSLGQQHSSLGQQHSSLGQQHSSLGQQHTSLGHQQPSFVQQQTSFVQQQPSLQQQPQFTQHRQIQQQPAQFHFNNEQPSHFNQQQQLSRPVQIPQQQSHQFQSNQFQSNQNQDFSRQQFNLNTLQQNQHVIPPGGELIESIPKYEQHISIPPSTKKPDHLSEEDFNKQIQQQFNVNNYQFSTQRPIQQNQASHYITHPQNNQPSHAPFIYTTPASTTTRQFYYSTTTPTPTTTTTTTTTEKPESTTTDLKALNLELPDEVPDDLRQQLLSSGILKNAHISVLDYDKVGDIPISALPPDQLANFYGAGGASQLAASEPKPKVVKIDGTPVEKDLEPEGSEVDEVKVKAPVEMKVVHYDPQTQQGQKVKESYVKEGATQVEPVVLNDQTYNRYLPLKVSGAQFPIPEVPELKGKNINSVVVLAPVDYNFKSHRVTRDAQKIQDELKYVRNEALKELLKNPNKENYKKFLERENSTSAEKQSVILLVTGSSSEREIFMYDVATQSVSKLDGELSAAFVDAAETNANEDTNAASTNLIETKVPPPEGVKIYKNFDDAIELDGAASEFIHSKVPIIDPMQGDLEAEGSEQLEQFVDVSGLSVHPHDDLTPAASDDNHVVINSGYSKTDRQMPSR